MKGRLYGSTPLYFRPSDFLKVLILAFILLALQASLAVFIGRGGYGPEWMLPLVIYVALRAELWLAVVTAFLLGIMRDALGGDLWGLNALSLVLTVWLFYPHRNRFNFFTPWLTVPLIFILEFWRSLFITAPIVFFLQWPTISFNPLPPFFTSAIVTSFTAPILFVILRFLTSPKDYGRD